MKKSRLKKSHRSKSKLSWSLVVFALFLVGIIAAWGYFNFSVPLLIAGVNGGMDTLSGRSSGGNTAVISQPKRPAVTSQSEKRSKPESDPDADYNEAQDRAAANAAIQAANAEAAGRAAEAEAIRKVALTSNETNLAQPTTPCSANEQLVTTSTGNHCVPLNGDEIACGVYAKSINNKCYKIGDEVSGGYKVCDWTIGKRPGVTWAFLSTNCPTKTEIKPGMPTNAYDCSISKDYPGWWSENEKTCVQVGQPITGSPLIVCGAGQRTDKQYNYPTLSTPEVCPSYIPPVVTPPAPAALSNEELERRQEDCRSSLKKYDIASGACIDLVKCTPVPLTTGAKSYTTCGSDGKIELKLCNNPAGFDANGLCPVTPPVAAPITPNAPSEEFRCGEKGGTWKNGQCQSSGSTRSQPAIPPIVINPRTGQPLAPTNTQFDNPIEDTTPAVNPPATNPRTGQPLDSDKPVPDTQTNTPAVTDPKAVVIPPPAVSNKEVAPETISNLSSSIRQLWEKLFPTSTPITPTTGPSGADPSKPDQDTQPSTSTSTFSNLSTRITNFIKEAVSTFKSTSQTTPTLEGRDNRESCSQQYQQKCEQGEDGKWYPSYEQNTTTAPAN